MITVAEPDVTVRSIDADPGPARSGCPPGAVLGAGCLVLGPLLLGAALVMTRWDVVRPDGAPDPTAIAEQLPTAALAYNLGSLGNMVTIGAFLALAVVVARVYPRTAVWGAALAVAGACSTLANSLVHVAYFATDGITPPDRSQRGARRTRCS